MIGAKIFSSTNGIVSANERDTDGDGIVDSLDNCPTTAKGADGYSDGCPIEKQDETGQSVEILGLSITWFIGIVVGIVLLFVLIVILRNRELDDEDWYDEDDDDDDYYEEDRLSYQGGEHGLGVHWESEKIH